MEGIIVKGIGGFYYVKPVSAGNDGRGNSSAAFDKIYQCKARGIFRKDGEAPRVGDHVTISILDEGEGIIEKIHPRKNLFIRPPAANVDCFVVVAATAKPTPNTDIIDKFAVIAEMNDAEVIICLNKTDLAGEENEGQDAAQMCRDIFQIYGRAYPVLQTSGLTGEGIDALEKMLAGKNSALAGPSGVGKSTIINRLQRYEAAETGEIGHKSKRGKHTTRHVELFPLEGGGMVFDTPGFTSFDILAADEEDLDSCYPEMLPFLGGCKYDNCRHLSEPDCRIRQAVEDGDIHPSRYASYKRQIEAIQENHRRMY